MLLYLFFKAFSNLSRSPVAYPLVTRPLTISEVVLEGSCQNKTFIKIHNYLRGFQKYL